MKEKRRRHLPQHCQRLEKVFGKDLSLLFGVEDLEEAPKEGKADIFISFRVPSGITARAKDLVTLLFLTEPQSEQKLLRAVVRKGTSSDQGRHDYKGKGLPAHSKGRVYPHQIAIRQPLPRRIRPLILFLPRNLLFMT